MNLHNKSIVVMIGKREGSGRYSSISQVLGSRTPTHQENDTLSDQVYVPDCS